MVSYKYFAYGLHIFSEVLLPELREDAALNPDVEIKCGKLDHFIHDFWATGDEAYHNYPNVCSFMVCHGKVITVDPVPGADDRLIRLYLLGRILGILLHQRGLLVLHGSAVSLDGAAVAFIGGCGSGKSTIAASLIRRKRPIIADDLVVISTDDGIPIVYPAFPQVKLCLDAAESLGYDTSVLPYVSPKGKKHIAALSFSGFFSDPLPLERIYLIEYGEFADMKLMDSRQGLIELVRNSYAVHSLNAGVNLSSHFSQCAKVAKDVPIFRLFRPFNLNCLDYLARMIEYGCPFFK